MDTQTWGISMNIYIHSLEISIGTRTGELTTHMLCEAAGSTNACTISFDGFGPAFNLIFSISFIARITTAIYNLAYMSMARFSRSLVLLLATRCMEDHNPLRCSHQYHFSYKVNDLHILSSVHREL